MYHEKIKFKFVWNLKASTDSYQIQYETSLRINALAHKIWAR